MKLPLRLWMMPKKPKQPSENLLQQNIVKLLQSYGRHDICWFAVPNGDLRKIKVGERLKLQGLTPGVADIIIIVPTQTTLQLKPINIYGLELKTTVGQQSKEQEEWQESFERAGGTYLVARDLDQAVQMLDVIDAFRPGMQIKVKKEIMSGGRVPA